MAGRASKRQRAPSSSSSSSTPVSAGFGGDDDYDEVATNGQDAGMSSSIRPGRDIGVCFLCRHADQSIARDMTRAICDQAVTLGADDMADMVHDTLVDFDPSLPGIGREVIKIHITQHMLHPSVRVGHILRSLLKLTDRLESATTSVDHETGEIVVDAKNVSVYLKVIGEVMQSYKSGEISKMLYGQDKQSSTG